ncbi:proteinral transcription factor ii-i repeat domain-containing protein 2 [Plakobranchus ocellatus]|uniref:Proteinral transcription factor ii-i repeat domain-containing protein 2 n=1 Tax=Plakobranchus ocellatus TaxID=259542 RepID=A0AAV3ZIL3_9GAST|nr:proteinral transcription factor ii-i repeat domain-containing protein 2 [Plakobranchus ocellatus]
MTELITELNLPISSAYTLTKAFKTMFPDSQIAKDFACGKTKSTAIIKDLSKAHQGTLLSSMRISPFTVTTDESNDCGVGKHFPLVIRTVDEDRKEVLSELLAFPVLHGFATGLFEFQAEEPKEHILRKSTLNLMTRVLVSFVRPSAMGSKQPYEVDYKNEANVKTPDDTLIGMLSLNFDSKIRICMRLFYQQSS